MSGLKLSDPVGFFGVGASLALLCAGVADATPGNLDPDFGSAGKVIASFGNGQNYGKSMAVQSDGKIVVAGYASNGSDFDFSVARLNADGSLDNGFGVGGKVLTPIGAGDDFGLCLAVQSDGRIVVGGKAYNGSNSDVALVRYNPDGTLDASFGVSGKVVTPVGSNDDIANSVLVRSDGRIVVVGISLVAGNYDVMVAGFNSDGSVDSGFGTNGKVTVPIGSGNDLGMSAALQSDGKIVVGGYARMGGFDDFALLRFTTNGVLDSGFGTDGKLTTSLSTYDDNGYGVAVQPDGKIVLAGESVTGTGSHMTLARYTSNGVLDGSFGIGGSTTTDFGMPDFGRAVAVRSDGKIFVAGGRSLSGGGFAIACFKSNGTLDGSFNTNGMTVTKVGTVDTGNAVALQGDGKVVVAGYSILGSSIDLVVLRYDGGTIASLPEIGVNGGIGEVVNGDATPSAADGTNFGNAFPSGEPLTRTFTCTNSGTAPLVLSGAAPNFVTVSGSRAFRVSEQPVSGMLAAAGGTATFTITFDPVAVGEAQATVSIPSDDGDENPFTFVISATGMLPEIAVSGNGANIAYGDILPSTADDTDFGTMFASEGRVKRTFTISNKGGSALHFSRAAPDYVTLSGSGAFQVTKQPASGFVETGGNSTTFEITYDPNSVGTHTGTVSIPSDDLDENPFTFSIRGKGSLPLPGGLDLAFSGMGKVNTPVGNGNDFGRSVAVQVDGRILVAGNTFNGSDDDFALVRYNADGSIDSAFGNSGRVITSFGGGDDLAYSAALQGDGKIVLAGYAGNGSNRDIALLRYDPAGVLDGSFGAGGKVMTAVGGGDDVAYDVKIQGDGKIVVVGYTYNGINDDMVFVRYNADGSLDSGFGTGGKMVVDFGSSDDYAESVTIENGGNLVVAGSYFDGSNWKIALARCSSWGSMDSTFSGDGKLTSGVSRLPCFGFGVALRSDGKLLVAGEVGSDFALQLYNSNGTLDSGFGSSGWVTTYVSGGGAKSLVIQPDGKIVVAGYSRTGNTNFALARYTSGGVLDNSFGASGIVSTDFGSGHDYGECVALQSDGKIVVAGTAYNGTDYDIALARYAGIGIPNIVLTGRSIGIENGDTSPRPEDNTDYGSVDFTTGSVRHPFAIVNNGTATLNLTGTPRVTVSGSSAFSVTSQPASGSLANGAKVLFEITYDPAAPGNDQAIVSIANGDSTANPFTFGIGGRGLTPFDAWRMQWFGTTEDTGRAASMADFDSDGVVNLIEWACNLDPTTASSLPANLGRKDSKLEFTYMRRVAAVNNGVSFAVQWSDDLNSPDSWNVSGVTQEVISDSGVVQVVRVSVPAESPRRFVRIQVSFSP